MYLCEICHREFKTLGAVSRHISRGHKITNEEYYLKYINPNKGVCLICGKNTKFGNINDGYNRNYCSNKCSNNSEEVRNKSKYSYMKKYGVEHPSQCEELKTKKKSTCMKNFGCENPSQNKEIKNKKKETCKKNYGCEYPTQNKEVRDKTKETCMKKFGCENPSQFEEINNKKRINFEKVQERYPYLVKCEELISGPNGEVLGHCKNSSCKNSKENDGYFELTAYQINLRNSGINSTSDGSYFYCCDECKQTCPLYGKSATALYNIQNEDSSIIYTSEEYSTWRNEVLTRQLLNDEQQILNDQNESINFCEICHSTENLTAHHIQPKKLEPGYALDPINGIILCQKCHLEKGHEKGSDCSTGKLSTIICK